jgi:carboxylesterase type B
VAVELNTQKIVLPKADSSTLPVLMFFHGGALILGEQACAATQCSSWE